MVRDKKLNSLFSILNFKKSLRTLLFFNKKVVENHYEMEAVPVSELTDVRHFKDGENLLVVNFRKDETIKNSNSFLKKSRLNFQSIITFKKFEEYKKNPCSFLKKDEDINVFFVKKGFLDYFKNYGNLCQYFNIENKEFLLVKDFIEENILENAKKDEYEFIQILKDKNERIIVCDSKGDLHMGPFLINYVNSGLYSGNSKLDNMVEYLTKRNDVGFVIKSGYKNGYKNYKILKCPLSVIEKYYKNIIEFLPSSNSKEGKNEFINLIYYPKQEDIKKLINWDVKNFENFEYCSIEQYIIKNILDCEKFLIK